MRKNIQEVYNAWCGHKALDRKSCSTDGEVLYSYQTPILFRADDGVPIFNEDYYSVTTTIQQNSIRFMLQRSGYPVIASVNEPQIRAYISNER